MFLISRTPAKITLTLMAVASWALGQGLTISARPGLVNYFEGDAFLNANPIALGSKEPIFLNANDTFSMNTGKAEILLMPGSFLRIGDHSQIRMISPSLVNGQLELLQGEAIVEAVGMIRGSEVTLVDHGAQITIDKSGLYRMTAGDAPSVAVIEGSVQVALGIQKIKLGKGHQSALLGDLKSEKFDLAADDDLYAWSSVRSQYEAAASYDASARLAASGQYNPTGWYFNDLLDSWAWLPVRTCFSPFGWGFYPPALVSGATVIKCPVMHGGQWVNNPHKPVNGVRQWVGLGTTKPVAIDPKHPPALGLIASSPQANHEIRSDLRVFSQPSRSSGQNLSARGTGGRGSSRPQSRASAGGFSHASSNSSHAGSGGTHAGSGGGHAGSGGGHAGGGVGHSGGGGGGHAGGGNSGGGGHAGGGGSHH